METLLKETTPQQAYQMFTTTFNKYQLPAMLDDAFIHFTNYCSSLGTKCINEISVYANQKQSDEFLDVLAVCHLFQTPNILWNLLASYKIDAAFHEHLFKRAKHEREIMGHSFNNHLYMAYSQTIENHQKLYNQVKQNIYTVESMILLINELKK